MGDISIVALAVSLAALLIAGAAVVLTVRYKEQITKQEIEGSKLLEVLKIVDEKTRRSEEDLKKSLALSEALSGELYNFISIVSTGVNYDTAKVNRFYPIDIFTEGNADRGERLEAAVIEFLTTLGIEIIAEFPPQTGSWFKRLIGRTTRALSGPEAREIFQKGKLALELAAVRRTQAEVNKTQAEAAKLLFDGFGDEEGISSLGSLVAIVYRGSNGKIVKIAYELSPEQMQQVMNNPGVLRNLEDFMRLFGSTSSNSAGPMISIPTPQARKPADDKLPQLEPPTPRKPRRKQPPKPKAR